MSKLSVSSIPVSDLRMLLKRAEAWPKYNADPNVALFLMIAREVVRRADNRERVARHRRKDVRKQK